MVIFTFFLLLSTLAFNGFAVVKGETEVGFTIKMSVTYFNNNETENWNFTEDDRAISLFMNNTWQTVQLINQSYPIENTTLDEDGNPIAILQFPESELKPGENISYTVTYYALSKPRLLPTNITEENSGTLNDIPEELKESYCGEGDAWLVNDTELQYLAQNIAENETKVLTVVKKFVEWIKQNINYPTQAHEVPYYPNETLAGHQGDCDDQAILLITLCRICKIPAYLQVGCIYLPTYFDDSEYWNGNLRSVSKRVGWHGWAMAYIPPWGWLPVDLTYSLGGYGDPLNAIKTAAVTSKTTLQYMNISQMDYIAPALMERDFLKNNNFSVYTQDEMEETPPTNHEESILERLFPWILITATVVVTVTVVGIFMRKWKREKLKELDSKPQSNF